MRTTRLCAAIGMALAAFGAQAADTQRVIVSFDSAQSHARANVGAAVAQMGGALKVDLAHINAVAVEVPASAVAKLRKLAGVKAVEEDQKRYMIAGEASNAPLSAEQTGALLENANSNFERQRVPYGIRMVQANATPRDRNAAPLKVCIIDSGLDSTHPDLQGVEVDGAYDPVAGGWNQAPLHMHGTHVAGTIAAVNNSEGVVGVAGRGEVSLYIVRVFGANAGWAYSSNLSAASQRCKEAGAKVINMSLGGPIPSASERANFDQLQRDGILSIAAAGNDGRRANDYPAAYSSVMSVAAVDQDEKLASFSTFNSQVDISAPGVNVWSTVPVGTGRASAVRQAGTGYDSIPLFGTPTTGIKPPIVAPTYDFGLGDKVDTRAAGKTCLIARGTIAFSDKVLNCQASGGVSAVIYNNEAGNFSGTLNGVVTTIPSVSISQADGAAMLAKAPADTRLRVVAIDYAAESGTSMASPHVAGVAAKLWRANPQCTNVEIRNSLTKSAKDLRTPGRDDYTGYGLVQLGAAHQRIQDMGCGN